MVVRSPCDVSHRIPVPHHHHVPRHTWHLVSTDDTVKAIQTHVAIEEDEMFDRRTNENLSWWESFHSCYWCVWLIDCNGDAGKAHQRGICWPDGADQMPTTTREDQDQGKILPPPASWASVHTHIEIDHHNQKVSIKLQLAAYNHWGLHMLNYTRFASH